MKLEKNKIVFASVLLCIILFIGAYTVLVLDDNEAPAIENNQVPVPKLEDGQKVYDSKLDALNDLKEVRQTNAPSIYDERLLDSTGVYDPDLLDKEKQKMVDSIYNAGQIKYSETHLRNDVQIPPLKENDVKKDSVLPVLPPEISIKEMGLGQQLFFASDPKIGDSVGRKKAVPSIPVVVDGDQTVKANYRLRMRSIRDVLIDNISIPRNTLIYGFVSFQPNRALITIENINHQPVTLKAFDFQDGCEGIYVENSFRADASHQVIGDVVQDINIVGVPQVSGIKKVFQRNHRNTKVTVLNNYQLILKQTP